MHSSLMRVARGCSRPRGEGVCLSACRDTPHWVWAWRQPPSPGCGPGDPLGQTFNPLCVWAWRPPWRPAARQRPGDPSDQTPQLPPWVWTWRPPWRPAARHAGLPPVGHAGMPPSPRRPAARHAGIPPECMLGFHPSAPMNRILDTHY